MKWTTIEYIHRHSRIDFNCEDAELELYANSAENTILQLCRRTYAGFIAKYGCIPDDIRHATLMLIDGSYTHRTPATVQNLYIVPYAFDMKVKPYMRLADEDEDNEDMMTNVVLGSDFQLTLPVSVPEGVTLSELEYSVDVVNYDQKDKVVTFDQGDSVASDTNNTITTYLNSEDLGIGLLLVKVTMRIPDENYPNGVRRYVQRVNPYVQIVG